MPKRLTEKQKEEIVKGFKSGINIDVLSQKYICTKSTIMRNLKKNLGELKFKELSNKSKSLEGQSKTHKNKTTDIPETNIDNQDLKKDYNDPKVLDEDKTASFFAPKDYFFEIAPIDYEMDNSSRKELSSVPISEVDFPRVVYMLVDK